MKKKILYVITKSNWGGAQTYIYDLALSLPEDSFDVAIAAGGKGPFHERLRGAGIRTYRVPGFVRDINPFSEVRAFVSLLNIYRKEKPDIIHLNSSKAGVIGGAAAFAYKVARLSHRPRVVFTVHGWGFLEDRRWYSRFTIFIISWMASLFQDHVILISRKDFTYAEAFVPRRKLSLIPLGIPPIAFIDRNESRQFLSQRIGYPLKQDTLLIGITAELTRNKGLPFFVQAMKNIDLKHAPSARAIVFGEGEDKDSLLELIGSAGLEHKILLLGFIPDARKYLRAFDMFVLPSVKEGLPYVIMEAMSAGLPILASDVGGIPDLVTENHEGLLVHSKDPEALGSALKTLLHDADLRTRFGNNAAQKASAEFAVHGMIEKTADLYTTLTS